MSISDDFFVGMVSLQTVILDYNSFNACFFSTTAAGSGRMVEYETGAFRFLLPASGGVITFFRACSWIKGAPKSILPLKLEEISDFNSGMFSYAVPAPLCKYFLQDLQLTKLASRVRDPFDQEACLCRHKDQEQSYFTNDTPNDIRTMPGIIMMSSSMTQRTKRKFVFLKPARTAETLFKHVSLGHLPIQYGGISVDYYNVVKEEDGGWIFFLGGNNSSGTMKYQGSNSSDGGNTGDGVKITGGVIGSGDGIGAEVEPLEPRFEFDDQEWVEMGLFLFELMEQRVADIDGL
nr:hypothetical protein [Tanacetum cinerariifolium]